MKKIALIILVTFALSCTDTCMVDNEKLSALAVEAEVLRKELNEADTPAMQAVLELQLAEKREEIDAVASECN